MEKKNTILLTVIAVATLLVAVVGATFAYFTANVTTTNSEKNTTTVTTRTIASATMTLGNEISSVEDALPGYKSFKTLDVVGAGQEGDQKVTATISLTPTGTENFGTHIKYSIYKVATASKPSASICTDSDPKAPGENGQYYDAMTCDTSALGSAVKSGTLQTDVVEHDIDIEYNSADTYYVLVEYENADEDQGATEQGQSFSVAIGFSAKA